MRRGEVLHITLNQTQEGISMKVEETVRPDGLRIVTGYVPESRRVLVRFNCIPKRISCAKHNPALWITPLANMYVNVDTVVV